MLNVHQLVFLNFKYTKKKSFNFIKFKLKNEIFGIIYFA